MMENSNLKEIDRLLSAIEKRRESIPKDYYSSLKKANLFMDHSLEKVLFSLISQYTHSLSDKKICDVGCGSGYWLIKFINIGATPANLFGIDLDPKACEKAKSIIPNVNIINVNAEQLPYDDNFFDIVCQFKVFCTILDGNMKMQIAREMLRVVKPEGFIIWCDQRYHKPGNDYSRGIGKREIKRLFPQCNIRFRLAVLIPPLARIIVPLSWTLATLIEHLPFMKSHYVAIIQKLTNK